MRKPWANQITNSLRNIIYCFHGRFVHPRVRSAAGQPAPVTTLDTESHPEVYGEYPKVYAGVDVGFGRIKRLRQKSLSDIRLSENFFCICARKPKVIHGHRTCSAKL